MGIDSVHPETNIGIFSVFDSEGHIILKKAITSLFCLIESFFQVTLQLFPKDESLI